MNNEKAGFEIQLKRYSNNYPCLAFCTIKTLRGLFKNQDFLPLITKQKLR
jgi:hypothetical protein